MVRYRVGIGYFPFFLVDFAADDFLAAVFFFAAAFLAGAFLAAVFFLPPLLPPLLLPLRAALRVPPDSGGAPPGRPVVSASSLSPAAASAAARFAPLEVFLVAGLE